MFVAKFHVRPFSLLEAQTTESQTVAAPNSLFESPPFPSEWEPNGTCQTFLGSLEQSLVGCPKLGASTLCMRKQQLNTQICKHAQLCTPIHARERETETETERERERDI